MMYLIILLLTPLVVFGQQISNTDYEGAICAGNWKALAESKTDTPVGHFCKAIANGVICEWRIMDKERSQVGRDDTSVIKFCKDILDRNQTNAYVHFVAATLYIGQNETQKAIEEYKRCIALAPNFAGCYYQLGAYYGHKGNWQEQLAWMDKAVKVDPQYSAAYIGRGSSYKETGRLDLAIEQFKKAVEILEGNKVSAGEQMGRAAYNWGWVLVNRPSPDNDQAIIVLTKAINADPLRLEAYNELGIAYKRKGNFSQAIKAYKEGIHRGDTSAMIYFNLGVSEYRNGNSQGAKQALEKAISLDPSGSTGSTARQWLGNIR